MGFHVTNEGHLAQYSVVIKLIFLKLCFPSSMIFIYLDDREAKIRMSSVTALVHRTCY